MRGLVLEHDVRATAEVVAGTHLAADAPDFVLQGGRRGAESLPEALGRERPPLCTA